MSIPQPFHVPLSRRRFLRSLVLASAGFSLPGFLAEALTLTPRLTEGPFYPRLANLPLDRDNDLVQVGDNAGVAAGDISYLSGRILDAQGQPIKNALVELWHADHEGEYLHSHEDRRNPDCDPNFAGLGQFTTGASGEYLFRTIKPGLYHGRARHFHFAVTVPGQKRRFCTQTFWNERALDQDGQPWEVQNADDMLLRGVADPAQRASLLLDWQPSTGAAVPEFAAIFDFVSGFTPVESTS